MVTQNQKTKKKAEKLAEQISHELKIETLPDIQRYDKFENS